MVGVCVLEAWNGISFSRVCVNGYILMMSEYTMAWFIDAVIIGPKIKSKIKT